VKRIIRTVVVISGLSTGLTGCRGSESIAGSPVTPSAPSDSQPQITAIAPSAISTAGLAWGTITGLGFASGASVAFGGVAPQSRVTDSTTILFWANDARPFAQAAGTVDVVVRNPGGRQATLSRGLMFAPPESFDFNGSWVAHAGDDYGTDMHFVIENNGLQSLSCGTSLALTLAVPPPITAGEFSFVGEDGLRLSGRLVSATSAIGGINAAPCANSWWADKH
jgi:hypothetical protein